LFTVLAFGLCAVFQEGDPDTVLIGRMLGANGCILQLSIADTDGKETEPLIVNVPDFVRHPLIAHRYRVTMMRTYAVVAVDGREFKVPRERSL
jgi:hypothetical protein